MPTSRVKMRREDVLNIVQSSSSPLTTAEVKDLVEKKIGEEVTLAAVWQQLGELHKAGKVERSRVGRASTWTSAEASAPKKSTSRKKAAA